MTSPAMMKAASAVDEVLSDAFHASRTAKPAEIARAVLLAIREPMPAKSMSDQIWINRIDAILSTDTAEGVKP